MFFRNGHLESVRKAKELTVTELSLYFLESVSFLSLAIFPPTISFTSIQGQSEVKTWGKHSRQF